MSTKALHITNGDELTNNMKELKIPGEVIVWREMLCEGPTLLQVGSKDFTEVRKKFLNDFYQISPQNYEEKFVKEIDKLKAAEDFDHIVLWFEFDLFCHINMLAAISFLLENKKEVPVYLVCSKKLKGEDEHQPLSLLSLKHLKQHYEHKINLTQQDLETAALIWELYCSENPIKLKPQIKTASNFEYLSSCIRAHIERFPNSVTGINSLEKNILKIIKNNKISSSNQLLGYALQYQGYYGYSDLQMQEVLNKLQMFYEIKDNAVQLTEDGQLAYDGKKNFYRKLKNDFYFGGANMYDFLYDSESHQLLKL